MIWSLLTSSRIIQDFLFALQQPDPVVVCALLGPHGPHPHSFSGGGALCLSPEFFLRIYFSQENNSQVHIYLVSFQLLPSLSKPFSSF